MKWHAGAVGQFYDRGENTVVYFDPASGDTHLISDFAAYLVRSLATTCRSLDIAEIIELASGDIEPEDLVELRNAIPGILNELVDLDIVATN